MIYTEFEHIFPQFTVFFIRWFSPEYKYFTVVIKLNISGIEPPPHPPEHKIILM